MQKSLKKNAIYNTILKVLNIIFPLITFPYVARVLSPDGVGKVAFALSVIQYFIIIAHMGIPTYAIRECAKVRDNRSQLTKTAQEILAINIISVLISYLIFTIVIFNANQIASYRNLLLIGSINILSSSLGVEWFYQAIEEYKYITIRSIFVKSIALALIFIFIKDESDYTTYALITVLSTSLAYLYNFIHLRKHINLFEKFNEYNFKRHLKPIVLLFAMSISVSIYVSLDKVMLGLISGNTSIGLYAAANKMIKVVLALVTSLGAVLLPRMAYYIGNNEEILAKGLISRSLDFIIMISIPATVGIIMLADPIIRIFAGTDYLAAISTIRIISPIIIAIGLSNLIGIQILISYGKERITLYSTIIGAIINFTLNLLLIPVMQQNGAATATLVAEITVITFQMFFAYSHIKGNIRWKSIATYFIGSSLIIFITSIINHFTSSISTFFALSVVSSVLVYFGFLYIVRNELVYVISNKILIRLRRKLINLLKKGERND